MITLAEAAANIGRRVVYTPFRGDIEEGVITGTSSVWVFVRFGDAQHSKATAGAALEFADPKTDDEAATPRADMGVRSTPAAVSATAVGAAGPASSSSTTEGRVTSEVATLPSVPQRKRGETDGEGVGLACEAVTEWQQVLGTCSPGATGSPEVTP